MPRRSSSCVARAASASARAMPKYVRVEEEILDGRSGCDRDSGAAARRRCAAAPRPVGDDVPPGHHRLARGRAHARGQNADGGGLPGAVRTEQAEELAVVHGEVERIDRHDPSRRRRGQAPAGQTLLHRRRRIDLAQREHSFGGIELLRRENNEPICNVRWRRSHYESEVSEMFAQLQWNFAIDDSGCARLMQASAPAAVETNLRPGEYLVTLPMAGAREFGLTADVQGASGFITAAPGDDEGNKPNTPSAY